MKTGLFEASGDDIETFRLNHPKMNYCVWFIIVFLTLLNIYSIFYLSNNIILIISIGSLIILKIQDNFILYTNNSDFIKRNSYEI